MKGTLSATEAHKQYSEAVTAYRKLIPDPALRMKFSKAVDGYVRKCVLGVWQADNASSITPRHVEFYNAAYTAGNPVPSALYWEVATGVAGYDLFRPPVFFGDLRKYDRMRGTSLARKFVDQLTLILLLFAAVDDNVSEREAAFVDACAGSLRALCDKDQLPPAGRPALRADQFVTKAPAGPAAPPPKAPKPDSPRLEDVMDDLDKLEDMVSRLDISAPAAKPVLPAAAKGPEKKPEEPPAPQPPRLEDVLAELDELCGLEQVKKDVKSLINLVKVRKLRQEAGLPVPPLSLHLVFLGNPGTGKTTVARLLAKIYWAIGVLPSDKFKEVDRSGLVAGFVGQTATKTQAVIQEAMGGILFIDEAYALTNKDNANDFGGEAIEVLLKNMEDHRDNLIVIVAGYTGPMEKFIHANPGLESRFNKYFFFEDYDGGQLMEIFRSQCKKNGYTLSEEAEKWAETDFKDLYESRDENFGNARDVRNLFEKAVARQADRVAQLEAPTKEQLMELTKEDLMEPEETEENENKEENGNADQI